MAYMKKLREKSSNTKKNTYVTSIMLDRKYFTSTHVVLVLILIRVEFLKELVVHTRRLSMHRFASVVQNNKDTSSAASAKVSVMKKRLDTMNSRIHALKDQQRANKDALSRAKSEKARADRLEKSIAEINRAVFVLDSEWITFSEFSTSI